MYTITNILTGVCIILVIFIAIVLILYFRSTPEKYAQKLKNENGVDAEIEKELKKKFKSRKHK